MDYSSIKSIPYLRVITQVSEHFVIKSYEIKRKLLDQHHLLLSSNVNFYAILFYMIFEQNHSNNEDNTGIEKEVCFFEWIKRSFSTSPLNREAHYGYPTAPRPKANITFKDSKSSELDNNERSENSEDVIQHHP